VGLAPHALPGLVAAIGQQPGLPGDLPARERAQLRAHIAEGVAGPHDQPEHVPVDLADPLARHLISGHDQDRLSITGPLLLRLAVGELQPMAAMSAPGHQRVAVAGSSRGV
jgi:hypothetical protein